MNWYLKVIRDNYINFEGRATRQEYWMFVLIQIAIYIGIGLITSLLSEILYTELFSIVMLIYLAATFLPWIALNVRRLHDVGKSGGYFFINFIPIIGRIWYIILMCTEGDNHSNKYGHDPKKPPFNEINEIGKSIV